MYDVLSLKQPQPTGIWAMEVLHAMVGWPDLYKANGPKMGDFDNMCNMTGMHSCAHLKLRPGWLAPTDIADHTGAQQSYDLHSLGISPPPPGRFAAVRIRSNTTGNVFMTEARLRSDVYERGFAPRIIGGLEFRGLLGEGVIVYQTHDNLQETYLMSSALGVGQAYQNAAEGFSVGVVQAIEGGFTVQVTEAHGPQSTVPDVLEMSASVAAKRVLAAGLVPKFTGASPTHSWVFSQSPTAGDVVAKGSTVTMVLHTGPLP